MRTAVISVSLLCVIALSSVVALTDGNLQGFVRNENGIAIAGATVNVLSVNRVTTGADGSYTIAVPAGTYSVAAYDNDHYSLIKDGAVVSNEATTALSFQLVAMPDPTCVVVDDFNRPDSLDVGRSQDANQWSWLRSQSSAQIKNNSIYLPNGGNVGPGASLQGWTLLPLDFDLTFDVYNPGGYNFAIGYRQSGYADPGYGNGGYCCFMFANQGGGAVTLYSTWLGHVFMKPWGWTQNWSVSHTMRVRVVGNHHEAWFDSAKIIDYFDTSAGAENSAGNLYLSTSEAGYYPMYFDNFNCKAWAAPVRTISGTVTDSTNPNRKIVGATVVAGQSKAMTDVSGKYSVAIGTGNASYSTLAYADGYLPSALVSVTPGPGSNLIFDIALNRIPAATAPSALDTFTRNDSGDLGQTEDANHWSYFRSRESARIAGGALYMPAGGNAGPDRKSGGAVFLPADFEASMTILNPTGGAFAIGYRQDAYGEPGGSNGGYLAELQNQGQVTFFAPWLGHVYQSSALVGVRWDVPHAIRLRVFGNHHQAWFDGIKVIDFFDSSVGARTSGGYLYLTSCEGSYELRMDDLAVASGKLLYAPGTITGTVTDATHPATKIPNAAVSVGGQLVQTDANGIYTASVSTGPLTSYSVSASAAGYHASSPVAVAPVSGGVVVQSISLNPIVHVLTGIVTDAADVNSKVVGATVRVGSASTTTGADGAYSVSIAADGTSYDVFAYADSYYASSPVTVTPAPGNSAVRNISLTMIPVTPAPDVFDTFSRSGEPDLGATEDANHWSYFSTQPCAISGGMLLTSGGGTVGPHQKTGGAVFMPADFDLSVRVSNPGKESFGIGYRQGDYTDTPNAWSNGGYALFVYPAPSDEVRLYSPWIDRRASFDWDWSVPRTVRIRAFGNHHLAWIDGRKVMDYIDESPSARTSGGYVYLYPANPGPSAMSWDDLKIASGARYAEPVASVAAAKARPLGSDIDLAGAEVTRAFNGFFYVEDPTRVSGIRVVNSASVRTGDRVRIVGATAREGEETRVIASSVTATAGTTTIRPLGMSSRSVRPGTGISTVGLLARVWGRVAEAPGPSSGYITINDGNGAGLRVNLGFDLSSYRYPVVGDYVMVTGIHTAEAGNAILVGGAGDISRSSLEGRNYGASEDRLQARSDDAQQISLTGIWQMVGQNADTAHPIGTGEPRTLPDMSGWQWVDVSVPGSVRSGLLEAGAIEDPYWSDNAGDSIWTESKDWWFKKSVTIPQEWSGKRIFIGFDGVDYYSSVWINGRFLGDHEGLYGGPVHDVTSLVNLTGPNEILVKIHPGGTDEPGRVFKGYIFMKWHYQTDISPRGIWRGCRLVATGPVRIENPFVKTLTVSDEEAVLEITADVRNTRNAKQAVISGMISGENFEGTDQQFSCSVDLSNGNQTLTYQLHVPNPKLWWPKGMGEPNLYRLNLRASTNEADSDSVSTTFGIRTLEFDRNPGLDCDVNSRFMCRVNGKLISMRGAGGFGSHDQIYRYHARKDAWFIKVAQELNFNFIRVHGAGLIAHDEFYDLCDRMGMMVWQEFMISNMGISGEHFDVWRAQTVQSILRLRGHPSLIRWCGGNEFNPDSTGDDTKMTVDMFEECVARYDGTRLFSRSAAYVNDPHYNDESGTYGGFKPAACTEYSGVFAGSILSNRSLSKFLPEVDAEYWPPTTKENLNSCLPQDVLSRLDNSRRGAFVFHTALTGRCDGWGWPGDLTVLLPQWAFYGNPRTMDEAFEISQVSGGYTTAYTAETFRSRWPYPSLYASWDYAPIWPMSIIWGPVDYYGAVLPCAYYYKRAQEPLHVLMQLKSKEYLKTPVVPLNAFPKIYQPGERFEGSVFVASDLDHPAGGHIAELQVFDSSLGLVHQGVMSVPVVGSGPTSLALGTFTWDIPSNLPDQPALVCASLRNVSGKLVSRSAYPIWITSNRGKLISDISVRRDSGPWLTQLRNAPTRLRITPLSASLSFSDGDYLPSGTQQCATVRLDVTNIGSKLAFHTGVEITNADCRYVCDDNYFVLMPGETKRVTVQIDRSIQPFYDYVKPELIEAVGSELRFRASAWNAPSETAVVAVGG